MTTRAFRECRPPPMPKFQSEVIRNSIPYCQINPDLDDCRICPKMLWMHYLVSGSHVAKYGTNWPLIVWEMLTNVQKSHSLHHKYWGFWGISYTLRHQYDFRLHIWWHSISYSSLHADIFQNRSSGICDKWQSAFNMYDSSAWCSQFTINKQHRTFICYTCHHLHHPNIVHSPVIHVIIFTTPTIILVWKAIDKFKMLSFKCSYSSKKTLIRHPTDTCTWK